MGEKVDLGACVSRMKTPTLASPLSGKHQSLDLVCALIDGFEMILCLNTWSKLSPPNLYYIYLAEADVFLASLCGIMLVFQADISVNT